jgi:hypothetical protein
MAVVFGECEMENIYKLLIVAGGALILTGVVLWLLSKAGFTGSLPGDIRIQGANFSCFIPIASMILLSVVLTVVLNIILRIMNK